MQIQDKSAVIFGNPIDKKTVKQGEKSKKKFLKKYGDDTNKEYHLTTASIPSLESYGSSKLGDSLDHSSTSTSSSDSSSSSYSDYSYNPSSGGYNENEENSSNNKDEWVDPTRKNQTYSKYHQNEYELKISQQYHDGEITYQEYMQRLFDYDYNNFDKQTVDIWLKDFMNDIECGGTTEGDTYSTYIDIWNKYHDNKIDVSTSSSSTTSSTTDTSGSYASNNKGLSDYEKAKASYNLRSTDTYKTASTKTNKNTYTSDTSPLSTTPTASSLLDGSSKYASDKDNSSTSKSNNSFSNFSPVGSNSNRYTGLDSYSGSTSIKAKADMSVDDMIKKSKSNYNKNSSNN